jgi:hypothetical protein
MAITEKIYQRTSRFLWFQRKKKSFFSSHLNKYKPGQIAAFQMICKHKSPHSSNQWFLDPYYHHLAPALFHKSTARHHHAFVIAITTAPKQNSQIWTSSSMPLSQNIVATYSTPTSSLLLRKKPKKRENEKGTCNASSLRTKITC